MGARPPKLSLIAVSSRKPTRRSPHLLGCSSPNRRYPHHCIVLVEHAPDSAVGTPNLSCHLPDRQPTLMETHNLLSHFRCDDGLGADWYARTLQKSPHAIPRDAELLTQ